ncbi:hypothetical protein ES707_09841 [subsurface metagenome]
MGAPGLTNWVKTIPLSCSAFTWAKVPARVTGEVDPAIGAEDKATGTLSSAIFINIEVVKSSSSRGLFIQEVIKEMIGLLRSASFPPTTFSAMPITFSALFTE